MGRGSETAQGAIGGAATGASVGAAAGPYGALIGGGIGGLVGGLSSYYGYEDEEDPFNQRQAELQAQLAQYGQGPGQIGPMAQAGMGGPFRDGQLALIGQLQEQAAGRGPSLAQAQFDAAADAGINQQLSAAQAQGGSALAARNAAANIGTLNQNLAGQAAQARIQEQLLARNQLAGVLGQGRGQELQGGQFNASQLNNAALAQAQLNQQYGLGIRELELQNEQLRQQALANQKPGFGSALLSGGASLAANYFANRGGGGGGAPAPKPSARAPGAFGSSPPSGFDAFGNLVYS